MEWFILIVGVPHCKWPSHSKDTTLVQKGYTCIFMSKDYLSQANVAAFWFPKKYGQYARRLNSLLMQQWVVCQWINHQMVMRNKHPQKWFWWLKTWDWLFTGKALSKEKSSSIRRVAAYTIKVASGTASLWHSKYYHHTATMNVDDGCIHWGNKVIEPNKIELHMYYRSCVVGHRVKSLARIL